MMPGSNPENQHMASRDLLFMKGIIINKRPLLEK
jgi:hypothetical protein